MKALLTFLTLLIIAPISMARISNEQTITFHVETLNWPNSLKPKIDKALEILMSPNQCWSYNGKTKVSFAIEYDSKKPCSIFVAFKDDFKLIPVMKNPTDVKLEISFDPSKNGTMKLSILKGDGKKLKSALSKRRPLKKEETADSLKDAIVKLLN